MRRSSVSCAASTRRGAGCEVRYRLCGVHRRQASFCSSSATSSFAESALSRGSSSPRVPKMFMTEGGIWPAIWGTILLVFWTAAVRAAYRHHGGHLHVRVRPRGTTTRVIRLAIANMAGVPSIVYGLFGLALFVLTMGLGRSVLAGALTLACLTLPVVITSTEEALRQVPQDLRQASLALGASRLRTTLRVVIPAAAPGIVTGSILGLSRAAGETAPILVTAVAFYAPVPATRVRRDDGASVPPLHHGHAGGEASARHRVGNRVRAGCRREHHQRRRWRRGVHGKGARSDGRVPSVQSPGAFELVDVSVTYGARRRSPA